MATDRARPCVLVDDDDPALRALYRDLLEDEGYRVAAAAAPPADVGEVARLAPDVIILDLLFGGAALGRRLLDVLARDPATAAIPVVVCTAALPAAERERDLLAAWDVPALPKPFDVDALLRLVAERVGRPPRPTGPGGAEGDAW